MRTAEAEVPARAARLRGADRKSSTASLGAEACTATSGRTKSENHELMERVVERSNIRLAYQRVIENKGAAGVDEMPVSELKDWLRVHWPSVKKALLEDRYLPRPVRRVDIPKPTGGVRTLGVPTVVDRLIQQALHQVTTAVRSHVLGGQLRLPAGARSAASGTASASVHPRR